MGVKKLVLRTCNVIHPSPLPPSPSKHARWLKRGRFGTCNREEPRSKLWCDTEYPGRRFLVVFSSPIRL